MERMSRRTAYCRISRLKSRSRVYCRPFPRVGTQSTNRAVRSAASIPEVTISGDDCPRRVSRRSSQNRRSAKTATPATKAKFATYNAYSGNGDVSGQVVYVNYGIPEDYEQLKKLGIDVKGKIALARYGKSWRGTKAKVAQENGAVGCLIYSDPRDDGYFQGDIYPKGAFRPPDGAQRGSVMDMPLYRGRSIVTGLGQ